MTNHDEAIVGGLQAEALDAVTALGKRMASLHRLPPLKRAQAARAMVNQAKGALSAAADAAVFEATRVRGATWSLVAADLGLSSTAMVGKAIKRHTARIAAAQVQRAQTPQTSTVWCDNPAHHEGRGMAGSWTEHHASEDCVDPHFTGNHAPRADQPAAEAAPAAAG